MTALLAIESNRLDETVIVDESILKSYGSGIYIQVGEELTLRDLLYGLMLRSGNDAAMMISSFISGSEEDFVVMMNKKASEIGMNNTVFNNSCGLDNDKGNYSSAYDMALLTSYAMKYDEYKKIVSTKEYRLKTNYKTYLWKNKNKLLEIDYITGGKTGFTERAKRTLVSTASKDNMNMVIVTLNDGDDWNRHRLLYEEAFTIYKSYKVLDKNNYLVDDSYYNNNLYIKNDVYLTLKEGEIDELKNEIEIEKLSKFKDGEVVGNNAIYLGDILLLRENIYISKNNAIKDISIWQKIWKWIKFW
ncbi:MAG: serine hydrolase [bacterium]|nr:serine hydrolase [bacterium]